MSDLCNCGQRADVTHCCRATMTVVLRTPPKPAWYETPERQILRESLSKNGPRAHTLDCEPANPCWMCRARRLLGIEEGR